MNRKFKRLVIFIYDTLSVFIAFVCAFLLRFDFAIPEYFQETLLTALPWVLFVQTAAIYSHRLYRGMWAFTGVKDLLMISRASAIAVSLTFVTAYLSSGLVGWPRSVFVLDLLLLGIILGGGRMAYRSLKERLYKMKQGGRTILVIGAGQTAYLLARELASRPDVNSRIIGFLDDDELKGGRRILGVPILGNLSLLEEVIKTRAPDEVIIAIPSLPGNRVKTIAMLAKNSNTPLRILPPIKEVLSGTVRLQQARSVDVEDLLRREVVTVDESALSSAMRDGTVLITGAGGSIGSELCRQVLRFSPKDLILLERSENNLYQIGKELENYTGPARLHFVMGDVLDEGLVSHVLKIHRPSWVLHAAAYKHVPLVEENVVAAAKNNVLGTASLLRLCAANDVKNFVLISTDKAVRPTSVMGASKRLAEMILSQFHSEGDGSMKTSAVRFGNVLDSQGSVVPLFRQQIAKGGPVTVTHPDVERYFMTIPEAASLVLQASMFGSGGEVFLLDMGEPVKIKDLAEELCVLSGLKPHVDIELKYTGLRPGEKLFEELLVDITSAESTPHPKIFHSTKDLNGSLPSDWMSTLEALCAQEDAQGIRQIFKAWIPEFKNETFEPQTKNDHVPLRQATH